MASEQPQWWERPPCSKDDCNGIQLPTTGWCLAHAAEQARDAFSNELERIRAEGTIDARGVMISAELLTQLLKAVPRKEDRPTFTTLRFNRAIFQEGVDFREANFQAMADFHEASFQDEAIFRGARFQGGAVFGGARFQGDAGFDGASFRGQTMFSVASFQGHAGFEGTSFTRAAGFSWARFQGPAVFNFTNFQGDAWFRQVSFQDDADFVEVNFRSWAQFSSSSFHGEARFELANFHDHAGFDGASFHGAARFERARFEQATHVGPLLARQLVLDGAVFSARVQLDVTAAALCARRAQFPTGAHLRLRYATVDLEDANLAAPAILAGAPFPFPGLQEQEQEVARGWERLPPGPRRQRWRPRLLSLSRADVAGLRLADVDLRACRFVGAHNLDRLRIEGTPQLALPPPGWHLRRIGGEGLPIWRWTRRMTLAEEQQWRATRPLRPSPSGRRHPQLRGWYPPECRPIPELPERSVRPPVQLAALYRELRKGREDAKDEPGAADFYYGEMEMRRHNPETSLAERFVLWLYWLTSGYSLRGLRALICLAVVIVVLAGLLHAVGFRPLHPVTPRSFWSSLLYATESTLSLGASDITLTGWGRALRIVLRLTGPVLLGLALLSVRNRVKR